MLKSCFEPLTFPMTFFFARVPQDKGCKGDAVQVSMFVATTVWLWSRMTSAVLIMRQSDCVADLEETLVGTTNSNLARTLKSASW